MYIITMHLIFNIFNFFSLSNYPWMLKVFLTMLDLSSTAFCTSMYNAFGRSIDSKSRSKVFNTSSIDPLQLV